MAACVAVGSFWNRMSSVGFASRVSFVLSGRLNVERGQILGRQDSGRVIMAGTPLARAPRRPDAVRLDAFAVEKDRVAARAGPKPY
jgi:hypothetical protein